LQIFLFKHAKLVIKFDLFPNKNYAFYTYIENEIQTLIARRFTCLSDYTIRIFRALLILKALFVKSIQYKTVQFRFYAELNDFLPVANKQRAFEYMYAGPLKLQEAILSIGVPLSEIDLILVNNESVNLNYALKGGETISVYPVFESLDISSLTALRPQPLRTTRFILDAHLGKLARYLRMVGFDTLYKNDFEDAVIVQLSLDEKRIILTRDKALLRSPKIKHGYYVRSIHPKPQLMEVIRKFDLTSQLRPFSRCITCNHLIEKVSKTGIINRVPNDTFQQFHDFFVCKNCDKIYWEGSHYEHMQRFIHSLIKRNTNKKSND